MVSHARWKLARERKLDPGSGESPRTSRRREEIRLAFELGQAVYDRRTELGMSQTEPARRAGMTQPQVSKLELGGTVPTVPLLARLARAMESELTLKLVGETSVVVFASQEHEAA
ncbi:helix-turn-helix transcriptional regulator [Streptomyces sp. NPDC046557]|uniref:helix-turn-helix domain-containing protein n=1 Tax=Streptomyces sp. NPDC046557 TaxID=3155372 RepID=UPI0033FECE41